MSQEVQLWQQCADWLVATGILDPSTPVNSVAELATCLRDGFRLCKLANMLVDGCIDCRSLCSIPGSSFSYDLNVMLFLDACRATFGLNESDVFEVSDLTQFAGFENVLRTLSALSHTREAQALMIKPFPECLSPSQFPSCSNDEIYCNLQTEVESVDEKLYDVAHYQNEEAEAQIYDRIVVQQEPTVEDTWKNFKPKVKRDFPIKELLDTETNYISKCLAMLINDYYYPLRNVLGGSDFDVVFGNIEDIYRVHQSFHHNLRKAVMATLLSEQRQMTNGEASIGAVFLKHKRSFLAYASYCANMKTARERLDEIERAESMVKRKISELKKKNPELNQFRLQDLLSVPFQRICKYHLLLQNIVAHTSVSDPDRENLVQALEACADVVNYVNEAKRDFEVMEVIKSIERSIDSMDSRQDFKNFGRLQLDGPVKLSISQEGSAKPKQRYVFIFERVLLICKRLKNAQYEFKMAYKLADYVLEEVNNDSPVSLSKSTSTLTRKWTASFFDNSSLTLVRAEDKAKGVAEPQTIQVTLKSMQQRESWRKRIQEAIDRNNPPIGKTRRHELVYHTFPQATDCDVCKKLLLGTFFQGYLCNRCARSFHFDCLANAYCRQRSTPSRASDPGLHQTIRHDRYIAIRTVNSADPEVLSFDVNEEIIIVSENDRGTLIGRKASQPGRSGMVDMSAVRLLSTPYRDSVAAISSISSPPTFSVNGGSPEHLRPNTLSSQVVCENIPDGQAVELQPWYFGMKERHQANELLAGKSEGTFIVRLSQKENKHVISVCFAGACKHMKIEAEEGSRFYLHDARFFDSIPALIDYYRTHSLAEGFDKIDTTLTQTLLKTRTYQVIHDYAHTTTDSSKYLELRRGDRVQVLDTSGENRGWWRFQAGERVGFFPLTYVKAVLDENGQTNGILC